MFTSRQLLQIISTKLFDLFSFRSFSTSTENLKSAQTEKKILVGYALRPFFLSRQRLGGAFKKRSNDQNVEREQKV